MNNINYVELIMRDNVNPTLFRFVVPDTSKGISIKNIVGYPWPIDSSIIYAGKDISKDTRMLSVIDPQEDEFICRVLLGRPDDDPGGPVGGKKRRTKKKRTKKKRTTKKKSKKKKKRTKRRSTNRV
tara:strand:- start:167 stop:544 length:378 start_codon:yes stop_codon:yes gene_type:complete